MGITPIFRKPSFAPMLVTLWSVLKCNSPSRSKISVGLTANAYLFLMLHPSFARYRGRGVSWILNLIYSDHLFLSQS